MGRKLGIDFQIGGPNCPGAPASCTLADGGSLGTPVSFDIAVAALYFTQ